MNTIKEVLKAYKIYLVVIVLALIVFNIKVPYYILAPGGIIPIDERIETENKPVAGKFTRDNRRDYWRVDKGDKMENKKNYEAPKMDVVEVKHQSPLLEGSYSGEGAFLDTAKDISVQV